MRIVIDMQSAQTIASEHNGIAEYTKKIVKEFLKTASKQDEVFIVLNGYFKESCKQLKNDFYGFLPQENIKVWNWNLEIKNASQSDIENNVAADLFKEWFLHQFNADVIWSTNFQEGLKEDGVCVSLGETKSSEFLLGTLYDLNPIIFGVDKNYDFYTGKWYRKSLEYIKRCNGVLTVSNFSKDKINEILGIPKENICVSKNIPDSKKDYIKENLELKYKEKENIILYIGSDEDYKNSESLISAFDKLPSNLKMKYVLILSDNEIYEHKEKVLELVQDKKTLDRIKIVGHLHEKEIVELLQKCKVFVFPSLAENLSLSPAEAIYCGALVLSSNTSSLPEIVGVEEALFNPYDVNSISTKIEEILTDDSYAEKILTKERAYVESLTWKQSAQKIYDFLKQKISVKKESDEKYDYDKLTNDLAMLDKSFCNINYFIDVSKSISDSRLFRNKNNIYIDCSCAIGMNIVTGIQRVTNALISNTKLICNENTGYNVIPVYTTPEMNYFVKGKFYDSRYNIVNDISMNDIVKFCDGDILLMPDLHTTNIVRKQDFLENLVYCHGVKVYTVLYDLIPFHHPEAFPPLFVQEFLIYLKALSKYSGVITDSKAVLDDYRMWKKENCIDTPKGFIETWFHLGCDFKNAIATKKLDGEDFSIVNKIKERPSFLVVSTIEPRKMHKQILNAFNLLWKKNLNVNLCFVGRYGWKMDAFKQEMEKHPLLNKNFFWLHGISDEFLEEIYKSCSCVIFASLMEGFGLSIIEGAQHGKPVILRDIPVFREVAGDKAFYFNGEKPIDLAQKLEEWLELYKNNKIPQSKGIECLTWKEATETLLKRLSII